MALDSELLSVLHFLRQYPQIRQRLCAPRDKTIVYSGSVQNQSDVFHAWELLAKAKAQDPQRFDYLTLEERLRQFHVVQFGETLFEHANRVGSSLQRRGLKDQATILWRALSGIYIQGAVGRVRALVLPNEGTRKSVFGLTEINVLLRQDVLRAIDMDTELLRQFKVQARSGGTPSPIVIF